MTASNFSHGCKPVEPCCVPATPIVPSLGGGANRYAFVLVIFILLVIVGAAFWF